MLVFESSSRKGPAKAKNRRGEKEIFLYGKDGRGVGGRVGLSSSPADPTWKAGHPKGAVGRLVRG